MEFEVCRMLRVYSRNIWKLTYHTLEGTELCISGQLPGLQPPAGVPACAIRLLSMVDRPHPLWPRLGQSAFSLDLIKICFQNYWSHDFRLVGRVKGAKSSQYPDRSKLKAAKESLDCAKGLAWGVSNQTPALLGYGSQQIHSFDSVHPIEKAMTGSHWQYGLHIDSMVWSTSTQLEDATGIYQEGMWLLFWCVKILTRW